MIKKILLGMLGLVVAAIAFVAIGLTWTHVAIRRERAPLPTAEALGSATALGERPVRVAVINTASQAMPRSAVLDAARDPRPAEPYVMSHPAFVLEWADGRLLLVDAGMTRQGAIDFGGLIETLSGGAPIQALGSAAERLGAARPRVHGAIFTHLHTDHVGGISELCDGRDQPLRVFMTAAQAERTNFTTRAGLKLLRNSSCVRQEALDGSAPLRVPGFPGVSVIAAGGHTPGSQIVVAHLTTPSGPRTVLFVGDIVNNIDGITHNIPKPFLYRLLVVPEDDARQEELRRYLRTLHDRHGALLLPAHDQRHIERSGISSWGNGE